MRRSPAMTGVLIISVTVIWFVARTPDDAVVRAQGAKPASNKKPNVQSLDIRADKLEREFVQEAAGLARDYEDAGQIEKSKQILEAILKLNPELPLVKKKIGELDEQLLSANEFTVEVDASKGWGAPAAQVFAGKPFRAQATGSYKFITNLTVGPEGFSVEDSTRDMVTGAPCGALVGVYLTKDDKGKPKLGKPFTIGAGQELRPKEDGMLFLRVNVPPGSQCIGTLKVTLSGHLRAG